MLVLVALDDHEVRTGVDQEVRAAPVARLVGDDAIRCVDYYAGGGENFSDAILLD